MPTSRLSRRVATRSGRRVSLAVAVTTLALCLAGCGSYTKRDFVLRAEGICNSTLRELRLLPQPQPNPTGPLAAQLSALATYLHRALPVLRSEAHALGALRRPSQSAAQDRALRRYLTALDTAVTKLTALAAAAQADNVPVATADERTLAADPLTAVAAAAGLRVCSNSAASYT